MLFTTNLLRTAANKLAASKEKQKKSRAEKFQNAMSGITGVDSFGAGVEVGFNTFIFACSILFFVLELMLLVMAVVIALKCTTTTNERVVHITMAIVFTLPYTLGMVLLNPCARAVLGGRTLPLDSLQARASVGM